MTAKKQETKKEKTKYEQLFGTPERAAETSRRLIEGCGDLDCRGKWCPLYDICSYNVTAKKVLKWLKS